MKPSKSTELYKWLKDYSENMFAGTHNIHTTQTIVTEIVSNLLHYKNKNHFLVMYNLEFIVELLKNGVKSKDITFFSDNTRKNKISDNLGVKYIMSMNDIKNKNRPVVLINSPYTNGEQDASEIYTDILETVVDKTNPVAIGGVSPENFINGGQKKKTLRHKMLDLYNLKMLNFLDQKRDWDNSIAIDTISFVFDELHNGDTKVKGRFLGEEYLVDMPVLGIKELANGETQEIHDWMMRIQTVNKVALTVPKKIGGNDNVVKLSVNDTDSFTTEPGAYFDSDNTCWRVVFGYMRANVCAVVPPNISIPAKYRYVKFNSEDSARKFRDFMLSEPVRFIMKMTYTSRTLDAPQIKYVPWIDLSSFKSVDDSSLYAHWNTSQLTQTIINSIVGSKVPF